jgi:hypothetical protein
MIIHQKKINVIKFDSVRFLWVNFFNLLIDLKKNKRYHFKIKSWAVDILQFTNDPQLKKKTCSYIKKNQCY